MPTRTCVTIFARPTASAARACGIAQVVIRGESHPPRRSRWTLRGMPEPRPTEQLPASLGSEPRLAATGDRPPADSLVIPNDPPTRHRLSLPAIFSASVTTDCGADDDSRVERHRLDRDLGTYAASHFGGPRQIARPTILQDGVSRDRPFRTDRAPWPRSLSGHDLLASWTHQRSVLRPIRVRGRRAPLETIGRPRLSWLRHLQRQGVAPYNVSLMPTGAVSSGQFQRCCAAASAA